MLIVLRLFVFELEAHVRASCILQPIRRRIIIKFRWFGCQEF